MWEKINKIIIQNASAIFVLTCCFVIALIAETMKKEIPESNLTLVNKVVDVCLMGVVGWLFTQSKNNKQS